ncbi:MAG: sulfatase-like hydrolase/transferase, partial [Candidatus Bathyarchaeota archaeon]|nr:sulfatase-like hydrolase/transferase [Candidatus Bathyarchaeota archaeon]
PFRRWQPLEQTDVLLAEVLWNKGYTSALITDTYHMHKPQMGFGRGFDHVEWIRGQESDPAVTDPDVEVDLSKFSEKNWHRAYPGQPERLVKRQFEQYLRNRAHWEGEEDHHIVQVVKAGMKWLEDVTSDGRTDNLFLWLDSFDPHEPWDPPACYADMYPVPEYDGLPIIWGGGSAEDWTLTEVRHIRSQYAGTLTMCDKWTGIFLEKVEELGLLGKTMIIFLSDHGEPLGEHGIIKKAQPWPYEELSHMPLIVRFPDGMREPSKGQRMEAFAGMPDIMPTILDFLDMKGPAVMQGRSLLPVIRGKEDDAWEFAISGHHGNSWSIRNREWSFYYWPGADTPYTWGVGFASLERKTKPELYRFDVGYVPPEPRGYELKKDQPETENLVEEEPEIAASLEKQMRMFIEGLTPSPGDLMAKDYMKRQMTLRTPPRRKT